MLKRLFTKAVRSKRSQNLRSLAAQEYHTARGAVHLQELQSAVTLLQTRVACAENAIAAHSMAIQRLENERQAELSVALQRYVVHDYLREVDGITPELRDELLNKAFRSDIRDLLRAGEVLSLSSEMQAAIQAWVYRYSAWLPAMSNHPFPHKNEIQERYVTLIVQERKAIQTARDVIENADAIQKRVQDEIQALSSVTPDDLAAVREGRASMTPRIEHFLHGVYAVWERMPDWYRAATRQKDAPNELISTGYMPCDKCERRAVYLSSDWISPDALVVRYWCESHAPEDAERFDLPDIEDDTKSSDDGNDHPAA